MIGSRGLSLIKRWERCHLEAYDDGVGVPTIGWGHTRGVRFGDTCSQEQADQWLAEDLGDAEDTVSRLVRVPINQAQRDALIAFVYNVGSGGFGKSELLRHLNAEAYHSAAKAFLGWTRGGGRPMRGLLRRRLAEAALFAEDPWPK